MADLLVRLYDLPQHDAARVTGAGVTIRRALAPERDIVIAWTGRHFSAHWASEVAVGFAHQPIDVFIAHNESGLLGFACGDVTARGFFGPTGVDEAARGQGIGEALLFAVLDDLKTKGFAYAVIGGAGPVGFYKSKLDAMEIPGSEPGWYAGMLNA